MLWQDTDGRDVGPLRAFPMGLYGMSELMLFVEDFKRAEDFYMFTMELERIQAHGEHYAALAAQEGGYPIGLYEWQQWWDKPAAGTPPDPPRLAIEASDIAYEHQRLASAGIAVEPLKGSAEDLQWFSVADPDGHLITFWQFNAAAVETASPEALQFEEGWRALEAQGLRELFFIESATLLQVGSEFSTENFETLDFMCGVRGPRLIWVDRFVPIATKEDVFAAFDASLGTYHDFDGDWEQLRNYLYFDYYLPDVGVVFYINDLDALKANDPVSYAMLLSILEGAGERFKEEGYLYKSVIRGASTSAPSAPAPSTSAPTS